MNNLFSKILFLMLGLCSWSCEEDETITERLSLEEYTNLVNEIIQPDSSDTAPPSTAREAILLEASKYKAQWEELRDIAEPTEVLDLHEKLVASLKYQYESNQIAGENTPVGLANTSENVNEYGHRWADVGYARDDQSKAACDLKNFLEPYGLTLNALGFCGLTDLPPLPDSTVGSASQPVNYVYLLHDAAYVPGTNEPRPNVDGFVINTIYAKANQPLTVDFDNRNPQPFVFSFSIYQGEDERLKAEDFVAGTPPYSGVKVQKLTTTLAAGTYSYVDNVHPIAVRGKLIVVP